MKNDRTQKLALAGVFCALAVVGSLFSFPVFGSKCAPVQHMVNVLCRAPPGPRSRGGPAPPPAPPRTQPGLGSQLAFPGGLCGALLCGLAYRRTHSLPAALLGEVFGTSVLGGLCAYPVAIFLMGQSAASVAFYAYIFPFLVSTAGGAIISAVILYGLKRSHVLQQMMDRR